MLNLPLSIFGAIVNGIILKFYFVIVHYWCIEMDFCVFTLCPVILLIHLLILEFVLQILEDFLLYTIMSLKVKIFLFLSFKSVYLLFLVSALLLWLRLSVKCEVKVVKAEILPYSSS